MNHFSVSSRGLDPVEVEAPNWVAALGLGLEGLGCASGLERLACEVLPNGTVIARDIKSGTGFVVQRLAEEEELLELDVEIEPLTEEFSINTDVMLAAIAETDSKASAAALALTVARELVPAESGAVMLEDRGYLRFVSVVGPSSRRLIGVRLPLGTGVAGFAMEQQRVVVLDDAHADPRHCGEVDALTGYNTEQIAVVPVVHHDTCLGVLELMNLSDDRRFGTEEMDSMIRVAEALASRLAE